MIIRIALCLPWYAGPDRDCAANFLVFSHYLGRLQERLWWLNNVITARNDNLPPLDPVNRTGFSEIGPALWDKEFEFCIAEEIGCSLPGLARDRCVEAALQFGADYMLFYDADMIFGTDAFLRLFQDDKPIVGALAFTGREPLMPVIFRVKARFDTDRVVMDYSMREDYEPDSLQEVDAIGSGMLLVKAEVFRGIERPWFYSTGVGEDIFFCAKARAAGFPVFVDTRVKTIHKPTFHQRWHDEVYYFEQRHARRSDLEQPAPASGHAGIAGA